MAIKTDSPIALKIKSIYPNLKPAEKKVADYILENPGQFVYSNLASSSRAAGVSEATLVRFAKTLGYSGYRDMHIAVAATKQTASEEGITELNVDENTSFAEIPERVIGRTICALTNMKQTLDMNEYSKAVDVLEHARRIGVFGAGNSAYVGQDLANKFQRLGKSVQASSDPHAQAVNAVSMSHKDVAVVISHSGRTQQTVETMLLAKEQGATIICITNFESSPAANMADIKLLTASHEKTLQSETMVSRLSQLAIVDMLYLGVIQKNYQYYAPLIEKQNQTVVPLFFRSGSSKDAT